MKKYLKFAESVARSAGKIMKKYYHGDKGSDYKGDNTIVTKADKEINDLLIARVKKSFPEHSVDGEEKKFGKSEYVWTCDPVDGTAMYARNLPVSVFSLALVVNGVTATLTALLFRMVSATKNSFVLLRNTQKICKRGLGLFF